MYRTNLKINVSTNVSGTDGEDLVCNIFDELMMRLSEFIEGKADIFDFKMNEQFFVKSKESLIEKLSKIERKLSENLDLNETLSDEIELDTGYCDNLWIIVEYREYNPKTFSQRKGTYAIKFTKDANLGGIVADINHDNRQYENRNIDNLIYDGFIEVGENKNIEAHYDFIKPEKATEIKNYAKALYKNAITNKSIHIYGTESS